MLRPSAALASFHHLKWRKAPAKPFLQNQSHSQGLMDIKQPRCILACYKGKGKLLALTSSQRRVTLDAAKSFSLPGLTRGSTELERTGGNRMWRDASTWEPESEE